MDARRAGDGSRESIEEVAGRLARILTGTAGGIRDHRGRDLVFEPTLDVRPLTRAGSPPPEVWAADGGQALVADARCLQVVATRAAVVCWSGDRCTREAQLPLRAWLLGLGEEQRIRAELTSQGALVDPDCSVDVNLLREWGEWAAAEQCVREAAPGSLVLVDGDLQTDWRIGPDWLAALLDVAADRRVTLAGVTKHTSLSWGGSPLLGVLERLAADRLGDRSCWWAPVGRRDPAAGPGLAVLVARMDPDARFSFRVDVPGYADPEATLQALAAVCDDAAFPGYPYPLSSADRLAACPAWVRDDVWSAMEEIFDRAGVEPDVADRAFADRHRLMERY